MTDSYSFHLGDLCTVFDIFSRMTPASGRFPFPRTFPVVFVSAALEQEASFSADTLPLFVVQTNTPVSILSFLA